MHRTSIVGRGVVVVALALLVAACSSRRETPVAGSPPAPAITPRELKAPATSEQLPFSAPGPVSDAAKPAAGQASQASPSDQPQSGTTSTIDRKIIRNATLNLQVKEVGPAYEQVTHLATVNGGFIASSRLSYDREGNQIGTVTLKVPAHRYEVVLSELRRLAVKVEDEQAGSNDVTEEYTDLQAHLRNLEATEAQYLEFLKQAKTINEVLAVQDRLNTVRREIERIKGRISLLDRLSDLATITVTLRPVPAPEGGTTPSLGQAAATAWAASLRVLQAVAVGVVTVAVFSWWLIPPLAALALFVRNRLAHARAAAESAPPS